MTFISVDLPAPFSPSTACTSPRRDVEVDVGQRRDGAEALADAAQRERGVMRFTAETRRRGELARRCGVSATPRLCGDSELRGRHGQRAGEDRLLRGVDARL